MHHPPSGLRSTERQDGACGAWSAVRGACGAWHSALVEARCWMVGGVQLANIGVSPKQSMYGIYMPIN